jgi:uncharacterized membrane protein
MTVEVVEFLLRWLHFLAGITWIGMLYYFNFVQTPFFKSCEASTKGEMIRGLVPNALWWFRWGAMFTFLSGLAIIMVKAHSVSAAASEAGASINWWATPYATIILTGGIMGTLMWFNVWFIIWPAQRDYAIKSAEQVAAGGEPVAGAAEKGALAARASRTNTLMSIPMLFFMGSARHFDRFNNGDNDAIYWLIALVVILAVELNAVAGPASPGRQKYLTTVSGTIHAGVALTVVLYLVGAFLN